MPAGPGLNLPEEKHSHGLRRLAAIEAARGSMEAAGGAITRATGVRVGKRQVEELARRCAARVEAFFTCSGDQAGAEAARKESAGEAKGRGKPREPQARGKWLTASVTDDIPAVIAALDEAERRDPQHMREWAVLIKGNNTQTREGRDEQITRIPGPLMNLFSTAAWRARELPLLPPRDR